MSAGLLNDLRDRLKRITPEDEESDKYVESNRMQRDTKATSPSKLTHASSSAAGQHRERNTSASDRPPRHAKRTPSPGHSRTAAPTRQSVSFSDGAQRPGTTFHGGRTGGSVPAASSPVTKPGGSFKSQAAAKPHSTPSATVLPHELISAASKREALFVDLGDVFGTEGQQRQIHANDLKRMAEDIAEREKSVFIQEDRLRKLKQSLKEESDWVQREAEDLQMWERDLTEREAAVKAREAKVLGREKAHIAESLTPVRNQLALTYNTAEPIEKPSTDRQLVSSGLRAPESLMQDSSAASEEGEKAIVSIPSPAVYARAATGNEMQIRPTVGVPVRSRAYGELSRVHTASGAEESESPAGHGWGSIRSVSASEAGEEPFHDPVPYAHNQVDGSSHSQPRTEYVAHHSNSPYRHRNLSGWRFKEGSERRDTSRPSQQLQQQQRSPSNSMPHHYCVNNRHAFQNRHVDANGRFSVADPRARSMNADSPNATTGHTAASPPPSPPVHNAAVRYSPDRRAVLSENVGNFVRRQLSRRQSSEEGTIFLF